MKSTHLLSVGASLLLSAVATHAQAYLNISPLSTFGGGDGWLSPGEGGYAYLGIANNERGLAYGNNHVYLVSRTSVSGSALNIRMLDKATGADLGGLAIGTGIITGGLFPINTIGVGSDGAIYVNNMTTAAPANGNFRVYRWANEASTPTVAFNGAPLTGARIGDTFDVIGGGSSTRLVAGYNTTPAIAGNNGYAVLDPTLGTATHISFTGTPPNAGDFRLGITFSDASHVWGTAGGTVPFRYTSYSGSSGTLLSSYTPASNAERLMDYTVLGGRPLLAVQSTGDSHVSIYDVTTPSAPVLLLTGNNTSGSLTANGNGTGQVAWGDATYDPISGRWSETLYAMSSNQGIQAFVVTIPEPGVGSLAVLGLGALACWRKLRR